MRDGRDADIAYINKALQSTRDPRERARLIESGRSIQKQRMNGKITSMREALIKEMRNGNTENVRDINEYIKSKSEYNE